VIQKYDPYEAVNKQENINMNLKLIACTYEHTTIEVNKVESAVLPGIAISPNL
jgi:hypothetical protein